LDCAFDKPILTNVYKHFETFFASLLENHTGFRSSD
jgi:hypothetical protein